MKIVLFMHLPCNVTRFLDHGLCFFFFWSFCFWVLFCSFQFVCMHEVYLTWKFFLLVDDITFELPFWYNDDAWLVRLVHFNSWVWVFWLFFSSQFVCMQCTLFGMIGGQMMSNLSVWFSLFSDGIMMLEFLRDLCIAMRGCGLFIICVM